MSPTNTTTFLTTWLYDLFLAASMVFVSGWMRNFSSSGNDPQMPVHAWLDINTTSHLAAAAEQSLDVITDGYLQDITPHTETRNIAPDFSTTSGSNVVTIDDAGIVTSESDNVRPLLLEVPGHQSVEIARWPTCGDTLKRLRQPGQRIDFVHLGGLDERRERGPSPSAAGAAGE